MTQHTELKTVDLEDAIEAFDTILTNFSDIKRYLYAEAVTVSNYLSEQKRASEPVATGEVMDRWEQALKLADEILNDVSENNDDQWFYTCIRQLKSVVLQTAGYDTRKWKLVPIEPTDEMLEAGNKRKECANYDHAGLRINGPDIWEIYDVMLAASPEPESENT